MSERVCQPGTNWETEEYYFDSDFYGSAVMQCVERDDDTLWVDNEEYATRVNYCPFCGYAAKKKVYWKKP